MKFKFLIVKTAPKSFEAEILETMIVDTDTAPIDDEPGGLRWAAAEAQSRGAAMRAHKLIPSSARVAFVWLGKVE